LIVCFCFTLAVGGYATYIKGRTVVHLGKEFYFLTVPAETVEVSALEIQKDGGAGFLLSFSKEQRMALAVYANEADGKKILLNNQGKYEDLRLVCVRCDRLYFGFQSAKEGKDVLTALNTLDEYISLLNEMIARVENGQTQEASKRILKEIGKNFDYLKKAYQKKYPELSAVYQKGAIELQKQTDNLVFAKDLRYVVCLLSKGYIDFAERYSV